MSACEDIGARRQEYAKAPRNGQTACLTINGTTIPNGINRRAQLVRLYNTPSIAAKPAIRAQQERSPRETAIVSFGKQAATSLLTTVAGAGFNEIMGTAGGVLDKATNQVTKATGLYAVEGAKGVLARSTMRLVNQVTNNAIGGLIGSVEFTRDDNGNITGLGMDRDVIRERLIGRDALAGYVSSFASSLAEGAIGEYNLKDANKKWLNSQTFSVDSIKGLNSLAGSAVSGAIEFGLTGSTTINVLNLRDLTGGKLSGGLLALTLGKDGISGTISSAGTDVSFGRLAVAAAGFAESRAVTRLKYGDAKDRMQLTIANGLGYTTNKANWALGRDIFTGAKKIAYDDKLRMDGEVKEYGYYDHEGGDPDTIYLNSSLLADGVQAGAIASSVVAHEGVHMRGERREALAYYASGSAFNELSAAWGVSDDSFQAMNAFGFMDERNWVANTGSRDYFGMAKDEKGAWGWRTDNSLDFSIDMGNKEIKDIVLKDKALFGELVKSDALTVKDGSFSITIPHGDMSEALAMRLAYALGIKDPAGTKYLSAAGSTAISDSARSRFARGTMAFAKVGAAAEAFMIKQTSESLGSYEDALFGMQSSGLLVKNDVSIDKTGLVGEGTTELPYLAVRAKADGTVKATGWPGFRFVNDDFYSGLYQDQVVEKGRSVEELNRKYPLHQFALYNHQGGDVVGSGDAIAQETGRVSYGYDATYGLNTRLFSASNDSRGYRSGHMSQSSVLSYLDLVGTRGVSLGKDAGGSYSLSGVIAGMVLGQQGRTGIAYGDHIHNEVLEKVGGVWQSSPGEWNRIFRDQLPYSYALKPDTWTKRYSGYERNDPTDPRLWQSVMDDWMKNGKSSMNYPRFYLQNLGSVPDRKYRLSVDELLILGGL